MTKSLAQTINFIIDKEKNRKRGPAVKTVSYSSVYVTMHTFQDFIDVHREDSFNFANVSEEDESSSDDFNFEESESDSSEASLEK